MHCTTSGSKKIIQVLSGWGRGRGQESRRIERWNRLLHPSQSFVTSNRGWNIRLDDSPAKTRADNHREDHAFGVMIDANRMNYSMSIVHEMLKWIVLYRMGIKEHCWEVYSRRMPCELWGLSVGERGGCCLLFVYTLGEWWSKRGVLGEELCHLLNRLECR